MWFFLKIKNEIYVGDITHSGDIVYLKMKKIQKLTKNITLM